MRALIVTPEYSGHGGGIATYYQLLAPPLVKAGCAVTVIEGSGFHSYDSSAAETHDGVAIHRLETVRVERWAAQFQHLQATPLLRRMMAGAWAAWEQAGTLGQFDVVESTDFALMAAPPALDRRAPLVTQMHGSFGQISVKDPLADAELDGGLSLAIEAATAALADQRQTSSRSNVAYWQAQTSKDVARLLPAWKPPRPHKDASPSSRIAVFGRIQQWKGPHIVCEALRTMRSAPGIDWYGRDVPHAGHASTSEWLSRSYPDTWGVRIKAHQPVPPHAVQDLQSAALLNLVPSTWDVFNFTAVEAMASGRPVVCSNAAGASELIEDGVTGFVYDGASPSALAQALERALSLGPERLCEIGRAARDMVSRTLDPDVIAQERMAGYKALCGAGQGRAAPAEWLTQLALPRPPGGRDLAFLDRLPMRRLADYLVRRASRKRLI
jgi:glycosyltransferase involved in cell wall biosynthesis